jgi:hypothetical protein
MPAGELATPGRCTEPAVRFIRENAGFPKGAQGLEYCVTWGSVPNPRRSRPGDGFASMTGLSDPYTAVKKLTINCYNCSALIWITTTTVKLYAVDRW